MRDGKYIFYTNGNDKKAGVEITERKKKKTLRKGHKNDKEGSYIIIIGLI